MATFPTALPFHVGSRWEPTDNLVVERSSSGTLRARSFWPGRKNEWTLVLQNLTKSQAISGGASASLLGFFDAWKAGTSPHTSAHAPFTLTIDGTNYNVIFRGPPRMEWVAADVYNCEADFAEV